MPRVEAKGKRHKPAARRTRAAKGAGEAPVSTGPSVLLDATILLILALAVFVAASVYYPSFSTPAGEQMRVLLLRAVGLGMYLVPFVLGLLPAVIWRSAWQRFWLRAWAWAWCLLLIASLGGGLFIEGWLGGVDRNWGGLLGTAPANLGYHYLGWFYPVLLLIVALIVVARLAGRSFVKLVGLGAYRAAVKTGAAVVDYGQAVREEAAEITKERRERRKAANEQRAQRDAERAEREAERNARRRRILEAELDAADAPEGDSPVIRNQPACPPPPDLLPSAEDVPVVAVLPATQTEVIELPADPAPADEAAELEPPETAAALAGRDQMLAELDDATGAAPVDDFARVVAAAGASQLEEVAYPGRKEPDAGEEGYHVGADGQLMLFASTQTGYELPPLSLLRDAPPSAGEEVHLEQRSRTIERTLRNFKIDASCVNSVVGPRVTRYELKIGPGINVSKIHGLADNLALELAVKDVRIEAPIPNKSAVGIEVPNASQQLVTLKSILESPTNQRSNHPLTVGLGRDIAGQEVMANISKMPHLLVAGATGSGKSVCLNALIVSLLTRNAPDTLRLILIDPKRVEMTNYQDLPHLACPVVHDVNEAQSALKWAVAEMDRRYRLLEGARARNIAAYNEKMPAGRELPFIVIIIDELADLMMLAGQVIEKLICRIAQLSRAVGIHLVIATQRPDVKVITGTIKANVPSRIAFAVVSHIDSRTILDGSGADKLLGSGDMLFAPIGETIPLRVQGAFLADDEIDRVVEWCRSQADAHYDESITQFELDEGGGAAGGGIERDEFFNAAAEIVRSSNRASTSYLQRRLKVGYNRAARIMEELEEAGIVTPPDHAGNREVM
ncbi:DNA translocase FtsK [bacterium]|nr:DNA translocase FtsK [bacterium]